MASYTSTPGNIVLTRDDKLARIVNTSKEDGVLFAWIRYLDGSNPSGDGAIDPATGLCEHRVKTGKVMSGTDYYNDDHWTTERGLRKPSKRQLDAMVATDTPTPKQPTTTKETNVSTPKQTSKTSALAAVSEPFKLTSKPANVLLAYLTANASGDADAAHRQLPFITEAGVLRVHPARFADWFLGADDYTGTPSKKQSLQVLKDAGLVQRVYALPPHDAHPALKGKSFGLYTGKATSAMSKLPRVAARKPAPKPAADKPAAAPVPGVTALEPDGPRKLAASELVVGDEIGTTRTDTRKALADGNGTRIAAITTSNDGRVQARDAEGKMIRSLAADTKVWCKR